MTSVMIQLFIKCSSLSIIKISLVVIGFKGPSRTSWWREVNRCAHFYDARPSRDQKASKVIYYLPGWSWNRFGLDALKLLWVSIKNMEKFLLFKSPFCLVYNKKEKHRGAKHARRSGWRTNKKNSISLKQHQRDFSTKRKAKRIFSCSALFLHDDQKWVRERATILINARRWVNQTMHFIACSYNRRLALELIFLHFFSVGSSPNRISKQNFREIKKESFFGQIKSQLSNGTWS